MNEERNKQIGQDLQKVRLDKGMSLDEIQQKTRIQTRYLQAIENGQFEQLPGTFYERAFVRQFANALDLDVDTFVADHDLVAAIPSETEATLDGARVDKDHVTRAGMHHVEEGAVEKTRRVMPKVLIGIAIVTILGVIWALVVAFTGSTNTPDKKAVSVTTSSVSKPAESSSESAKSESKKESSASSSSKKEETEVKLGTPVVDAAGVTYNDVQLPKDKPSTLKVQAKGDVWLQVTGTDGTVLMNDTLKSGTSQSLEIPTTMTGLTMQIGNATMLTTELDGTDLPLKNGNVMVWRSALNFKR